MLPIHDVLPALLRALRDGTSAVLQAPPGAGKTTVVPLALLDEPWLAGGKVLILEPRRLAARAAARRMSELRGEAVGGTVGYRVRMDTRVGPRTRVEVVTEGVLARMLHGDPSLEGVGCVVFDEYHERSLHADLGLALVLQARELLRPELRVLVMSATLDGAAVAALLGDAPVVASEGRAFPVELRWRPPRPQQRIEAAVAAVVREALADQAGDVLAFLPGAAEIGRAERLLRDATLPPGTAVHALHGALAGELQDDALRPSAPGRRKVVLATNVAQTSLTIEGVTAVVDAGLQRAPRFSPRAGMSRLETGRVSRASAEQRRGRAGRLAPGTCYRLWAEHDHHALAPFDRPEILEADLAPLALELAAHGVVDPAELRWLDLPPAAAFAQARELLGQLGAVDEAGRPTAHGREMAAIGAHPRLAHMLLRARDLGHGATACAMAAVLVDRDVLRRTGRPADPDLRLRLQALAGDGDVALVHGQEVDRDRVRQARDEARQWRRQLGIPDTPLDGAAAGLLVALAYPDRVALRRAGAPGRYLLRAGVGASLPDGSALAAEPVLAVAETDGRRPESQVRTAAPLEREELERLFAGQVSTEEDVAWDDGAGAVRAVRRERLGALVLSERRISRPDDALVRRALVAALRERGAARLPWSDAGRRTRERLGFLHALDPAGWPDVGDDALLASLDAWLAPHLDGVHRLDDVARVDLGDLLLAGVPWERRRRLDELAPTHVEVPSGSRIPVDYADPAAPVLAVRLQELFGLAQTPHVGGGRVPLTLHLLSPARRPVQVTRDLAGFWRSSYFDVRKELRGRYPKHHWPDDPMTAPPTSRAKRRGE